MKGAVKSGRDHFSHSVKVFNYAFKISYMGPSKCVSGFVFTKNGSINQQKS
ncbi:hypothetical protein K737_300919 [Holospora undulata HU1]|uniref:Uncharacterized protein n=1 Tax=Holospora undulata HU1 TaxID=1321371 RepID=A0A061JHA4_9PROT|nr:hypothetical protein K737_300919 [Holospora undulata HU1]